MELRHLAFGYLRRRKGKAALITFGLAVAVGSFVLVLSLVLALRATMDDRLTKYGSNLVIMPAAAELNLSYGGMSIAGAGSGEIPRLTEADLATLQSLPSAASVAAALPVVLEPIEVDGHALLGLGTDIRESLLVKPWWKVEGAVPARDDEVLVGLNVRNDLGLNARQQITVEGRDFTVSGVLWETGGEEDNLVVFDRRALGELTGNTGMMNLIEVTAAATETIDPLTEEIEAAIPGASVVSVKQSIEFTERANSSLADFGLAVTLLIVVIAGGVVMITMLTAVKERQKEIGILRAVGYKQRHIATLVLLESLMLSTSGAILGALGGLAGAAVLPRFMPSLSLGFVVDPFVLLAGVGVAYLVGLSAALYPAWRAAGLDPATALKYV
ncbi:MAG: ABC transporter permease [Thermoleophilia bacterium]